MEYIVEFCQYVRCNADLISKFQDRCDQVGDKQETMTIKMKLEYVDDFMTLIKWVLISFTSFCSKKFSLSVPFFEKFRHGSKEISKLKRFPQKYCFPD
jgi:hypothetical protein